MNVRTVPGPLSRADREGVDALAGRAAEADGVAPLDEAALLALADAAAPTAGSPLHVLAREQAPAASGTRLVGYAYLDRGGPVPTAQLVVDPAARRHGIGRALVGALLDAATADTPVRPAGHAPQAGGTGPDGTGPGETGPDGTIAGAPRAGLEAWAHGDLPAARALAAAAGFVRVHELWRMSLDLGRRAAGTDEPRWPDGLVVRPFAPGHDEEAWLAVNARAFADHPEQGRWTSRDLAAREREPWFDPAGFLLAARGDGSIAGFVWTKVHAAGELADHPVGEVYVLGVDPLAQGAGLGRALTAAGLDLLAGLGLRTAVLWVAGDNAAAIRTYRRAGFERAALDVRYARRAGRGTTPPDGATMGS
jgi:mycothiol synthase